MSKKSFARLIRIVTGTFGTGKDEVPSLETSLTKLEKFAHFWVLVSQSFVRNRCPVRASALSYATLLALIPMLAVAMSVTSMFLKSEGQEQIESFIQQFVERMVPSVLTETNAPDPVIEPEPVVSLDPEVVDSFDTTNAPAGLTQTNAPISDARVVVAQKKAANYIHTFIQNTYSGTLGATGVIMLIFVAISMLSRIEATFNDIWGVARGRNWLSRIVLYWATITLGPLLLVGALGLASGSHFTRTRDLINTVPFLEPVISQLLPVVVICVTFALFYKLVPNTKVHFTAALVGGAMAGTGWHIINSISLSLATGAVNASKIYGSLALIPLFMASLYMIWLTVLFGAQVAYAFQNRDSYLQEKLAENVNQRGREFVALRLMTCIGQRFDRSLPPPTISEMSRELGIPTKLVQQVLQTLLAARLVVEASGPESGYVPARPLQAITCHHVLLAMRATQGQELRTREEPARAEVYGEFARIQAVEKEAASAMTMLALVNRAQSRLELAAASAVAEPSPAAAPAIVTELPFEPKPGGAQAEVPAAEPELIEIEPAEAATPAPSPTSGKRSEPAQTEPSNEEDRSFPL
jgi:membrane protein